MKSLIAIYVIGFTVVGFLLGQITGYWISFGAVGFGTVIGCMLGASGCTFETDEEGARVATFLFLTRGGR